MIKRPRFIASLYTLSGVILAFTFSWLILSVCNFSYGFWHDHGGIAEAIEQYGGQNKYRSGFELTTKPQREHLFSEIVYAIHRNGEGLRDIRYQVPGHPQQLLLTDAEVQHLEDVARIIHMGAWLSACALLIWLMSLFWIRRSHQWLPDFKFQLVGIVSAIALCGVLVAALGPVNVFYTLHTWVFPEGHAWFFYYQESLMSTMMFAPVLFGWIAVEWLVLSIVMFCFIQLGTEKIFHLKRTKSS